MNENGKLFYNGRIYTMTAPGQRAEALVSYNGKIVFAGDSAEAEKYPVAEREDLEGRTVLPGFIDTHMHLVTDCLSRDMIDVSDAKTIDDVVEMMRAGADDDKDWIIGSNLHLENLKEGRFPLRRELDRISDGKPVLIHSYCHHAQMANSAALNAAGIHKGLTPQVEGTVEFYDDGEPNGITRETAYGVYYSDILDARADDPKFRRDLLRKNLSIYSRRGITTLHTFSSISAEHPLEYINQYMDLEAEGALPLRVVLNSVAAPYAGYKAITGFGTDKVNLGAKKIFCDGSMSSRSAALIEPYSDLPGERGILNYTHADLREQIRDAYEAGMEVAIHAIGDRAMEEVISSIEEVYRADAPNRMKFRIIHASLTNTDQIERMKKLPIILDVQPIFVRSWVYIAEDRLGKDRVKLYLPFKTYLDNGLLVTGGSDAPVDLADPLIGIQCAVTRQDLFGYPDEGFLPEQALSVYEAASLFTRNAAYCSNEKEVKGTLEKGKFTDLAVLDRDIFETDPHEIHKIRVLKTILGGETVWSY
jgi:predicted amidohydrolase YtcJ